MHKTLIAAAAALASLGASAQVTLYGLADVSLTRVTGYAQGGAPPSPVDIWRAPAGA